MAIVPPHRIALSLETLEYITLAFLNSIVDVYPLHYEFYSNLVLTGARITEMKTFSRWQILQNGDLLLNTEKNNNNRIFKPDEVTEKYYISLVSNYDIFYNISARQFTYFFNTYYPAKNIQHKTKPLSCHVFRHLKAKKLKSLNKTDEEIQIYLGEKELKSAENYIYSQLTY
jgi:integrase